MNIDRTAPEKPVASADVTALTNGDVAVSADFSADSVTGEYSMDSQTWKPYAEAITFTENGTVYFRGTDEAGNVSEATTYEVKNIETVIPDMVKPTVSSIVASTTVPTNQTVTVTAVFADDVELASALYRLGENGEWLDYEDGVTVSENTTVFFKAVDAAGNEATDQYEVSNIDKVAPEAPAATANVTAATNGNVLVSAQFSDDSIVKEYSLDGQTWLAYTAPIAFTTNGSVCFRGTDAAGNVSDVTTYTVSNIVIPDNKPDSDNDDYLYDKKNGWNDANISVTNTITGNGEINLDASGTVDKDGKHNLFGNDGTIKDSGDVAKIGVETAAKLTFTIDSTAAGTFYVYEDGFDKKGNRKQITVGKVTVKAGQTATLKNVCLTADGTYYVAMIAKNVRKAGTEGLYNVTVTATRIMSRWTSSTSSSGSTRLPMLLFMTAGFSRTFWTKPTPAGMFMRTARTVRRSTKPS